LARNLGVPPAKYLTTSVRRKGALLFVFVSGFKAFETVAFKVGRYIPRSFARKNPFRGLTCRRALSRKNVQMPANELTQKSAPLCLFELMEVRMHLLLIA
jgi:hypothetical protein